VLIVGFNAYHGDVSAAVLRDGRLIAALEEERFCRQKHVAGFPARAITEGLRLAGAAPADVDIFAVARGRRVHLVRKALFALRHRPGARLWGQSRATAGRQAELPAVIGSALGIDAAHVEPRLRHVEHHPAHLASAFYASGLDDAACAAIDGFGDFVSVSVARGSRERLDVVDRVYFPHSLGLLYLAVTQHLGFKKYGDEYKVMGLAPYGRPTMVGAVRRLLELRPNGRFRLALEYFRHWTGEITMQWDAGEPVIPDVYSERIVDLLGPARRPDEPITPRHEDVAASLQHVFEEAVFHVLRGVHQKAPSARLCLAGGCAMNSVANGKIRANTPFREVYIQPAAGDNGTALGAALHVWHDELGEPRAFRMDHAYWGTSFTDDQIASTLGASGAIDAGRCRWEKVEALDQRCRRTAARLADGCVVGWFQGRMEWGARALGNRSILADPRRRDMRDLLNRKIKLRERFRPFAPSILEEAIDEYFVGAVRDPFMLQVYPVRPDKREVIPAVTHVDGSGRLQSVGRDANPEYWTLLKAFETLTGVPVLLNTSFNENEPIVQRPEEALDCFLRTGMDVLVMGSHVLEKPGLTPSS
jgi:carbamoyltransferase